MNPTYVIGIDYGTQSARAQVIALKGGQAVGEAVFQYPHGVMSRCLPDGTPLPGGDWALAHPQDEYDALKKLIPQAVKSAGIRPEQVKGLSIAATACTLLPVDERLTPLCLKKGFEKEPHAYVKLWKHHRAKPDADRLTRAARERNERFLQNYGGAVSCEWALPKMMEVYREAPKVYRQAAYFMQFSDWLDSLLTGKMVRGGGISAYKALYDRRAGYPDDDYLRSVDVILMDMVHHKLRGKMCWPGERIGGLTAQAAAQLGLMPGTAVASGHTDAHAAALGVGVCRSGDCMTVLGTSSVTHFLHASHRQVSGISGMIRDGLLPGFTCYTAGQPCVGDMLEWFVRLIAPEGGQAVYGQLESEARALAPGKSGLMALDWWNGNRSLLANSALSGLLLGLSTQSSRGEIYLALMESIAFGQRMIRDQYRSAGLDMQRVILSGGMVKKSPLMCQLLADALNMPLETAGTAQATARGAAMCAAAAVPAIDGGCETLAQAVERLRVPSGGTVTPRPMQAQTYAQLFAHYKRLHDLMGRENPQIMASLKSFGQ